MFYVYLLNPFSLTSVSFTESLFSFCFHDLSIGESGVLSLLVRCVSSMQQNAESC